MNSEKNKVLQALSFLQKEVPDYKPEILLVLGSGLGNLVQEMRPVAKFEYGNIPNFAQSTVEGHAGSLFLCQTQGISVAVLSGRVHLYEGFSALEVVRNLRVIGLWGARTAILTNAAGALNPLFEAGNIMLTTDQINMTGENPLIGENIEEWGPRFPDMSKLYHPELIALARESALSTGIPLERGVYMGIKGPSLETPAETRAFRRLGADAIGMSTTLEAIAAKHLGMRVMGYSCLTNKNLPDCMDDTSHEEILRQAESINRNLIRLLKDTLPRVNSLKQED